MGVNRWFWMMDYCKKKGIPAAESWAWKQAKQAYNKFMNETETPKEITLSKDDMIKIRKELDYKTETTFTDFKEAKRRTYEDINNIVFD